MCQCGWRDLSAVAHLPPRRPRYRMRPGRPAGRTAPRAGDAIRGPWLSPIEREWQTCDNTGIVVLYGEKSCTSVARQGGIRLERLVVLGTTEYLVPIRHNITVPPCFLGTIEGGVRGVNEFFFAGHFARSGTGDTKADGNGDHFFMVDKTMFLDLLPETAGQDLRPRQIGVGENQGKLLPTVAR